MGRLSGAVEVDVSAVVPFPGPQVVRGLAVAASNLSEPLVWCCLPGGRCTSTYFDLAVEGDDGSYSMAAHLADAGGVVLAIDHLGTGASTPSDDIFLLTPEILAAAGHAAFTELLGRFRKGSLLPGLPAVGSFHPIGLGHSMGAMITIVQQARYETYGAVVNLGATGTGLPEHLRDPQWAALELDTVRASLVDLARLQFGVPPTEGRPVPLFHADDVPRPVRTAFRGQQTNLLPSSALASLLPSFTDLERGAVTVPLFLGFGALDLSSDAHDSVRRYTSSSDITLFILEGSGHCHNQAGNRRQLWERMLAWARAAPLMAS
jgi:pimeloyl-ACP methyl ester carboxylesterase